MPSPTYGACFYGGGDLTGHVQPPGDFLTWSPRACTNPALSFFASFVRTATCASPRPRGLLEFL